MKIISVTEPTTAEHLPILVDHYEMPMLLPTEFAIARHHLSPHTVLRQLREIKVLYFYLHERNICLWERIRTGRSFTESEITTGIFSALRKRSLSKGGESVVSPKIFNQRLATIRQYISWCFDKRLVELTDSQYERVRDAKEQVIETLSRGFITAPPAAKFKQKGLTDEEAAFLTRAEKTGAG